MSRRFAPRETHFRIRNSKPPAAIARDALTPREETILAQLVATGAENKAIGHALGICEGTVKAYMLRLSDKLSLLTGTLQMNRTQIALWAERTGRFRSASAAETLSPPPPAASVPAAPSRTAPGSES